MFNTNVLCVTGIPESKREKLFKASKFKITGGWSVEDYANLIFAKNITCKETNHYVWNTFGGTQHITYAKYSELDILDFIEWCDSPPIVENIYINLSDGLTVVVGKDTITIGPNVLSIKELEDVLNRVKRLKQSSSL